MKIYNPSGSAKLVLAILSAFCDDLLTKCGIKLDDISRINIKVIIFKKKSLWNVYHSM
jgi:hypothetical protein